MLHTQMGMYISGWSYDKEPLLVFEFMTNGSLDQHLFPRGGNGTGNQQERLIGPTIRQWSTRYGIIRDVATGLHYVHHEYEPMVLHRDIKASNVMLDSSFGACLGDFGLACTVSVDQNSASGVFAGTFGYMAPEYAMSRKATRKTDIYAFGVLILEVVTGKPALIHDGVSEDDVHITDRVWRLHGQQRLPECLDTMVLTSSSEDDEERQLEAASDAERLLLLGLACSSTNPSERPTMPEVVQIIAKSAPPPMVPLMKPRFLPPEPEGVAWSGDSSCGTWMSTTRESQLHVSLGPSETRVVGRHASLQVEQSVYVTATSAMV
jgi:interleukin-1 receptor-associated kinase 1